MSFSQGRSVSTADRQAAVEAVEQLTGQRLPWQQAYQLATSAQTFMERNFSLGRHGLRGVETDEGDFQQYLLNFEEGTATGTPQSFEEWQTGRHEGRTAAFNEDISRFLRSRVDQMLRRGGAGSPDVGAGGRLGGPAATYGAGFGRSAQTAVRGLASAMRGQRGLTPLGGRRGG